MALQKLGKYEIQSEIGRGAMGLVYRALDPILEREVAIKTMMASMGGLDSESKARFYREAKSAAKLTHRNIVTIYDMGEEEGVPYIAMEFLSGVDLHRKMKMDGTIPLREALDITSQILRGLNYAHEFRIVHRDIKPANVYILTNGTVKILDFGIAKLASSEMTRTGMVLGTVDYMSPEQIRADKGVDGRSDLFSVGVILYELISGRKPFPGDAITQIMYRIVHEAPVGVPTDREIPDSLLQITKKALSKSPDDRFQSGTEFAKALEGVIQQIDADLTTIGIPSPEIKPAERISTARRLFHSGSFENSAAILKEVLENDPANESAGELSKIVSRRLGTEDTAALEAEPVASSPSHGSSIEDILQEIEQERKTTPPDPARSDATAPDLTLRLEETGLHEAPAPDEATRPPQEAVSVPPTQAMISPEPLPKPSAKAPPKPAPAPSRPAPTARPRVTGAIEAMPAPAKSRLPLLAGAAAGIVILSVAGYFGYKALSPAAPSSALTEKAEPAAPSPPVSRPPAVVAPGFLALDAQPWAQVVRVRAAASGAEVALPQEPGSGGGPTTPVVLDLPAGTYEVTLRHPAYGEVTLKEVGIAAGEMTRRNETMPGFDYKARLPR